MAGTPRPVRVDAEREHATRRCRADVTVRTLVQTESRFERPEIVSPGMVEIQRWRSDDAGAPSALGLAGVGRLAEESQAAGVGHGRS